MKIKQQKRILSLFQAAFLSGFLFVLVSIGCLVAERIVAQQTYTALTTISPSTDTQIRRDTYYRAIQLAPEKTDAYLLLLDAYNEDGIFSQAESEEFLSIYNANHNGIERENDDYTTLHYKAGSLYISGYDGNTATRLRMALPFLEEAQSTMPEGYPYEMAVSCYCRIGSYYRDYIWEAASAVREVPAAEVEALIMDISDTLSAFASDNSADATYNELGFCFAVCNLLYDQRDILAATVPQDTVIALLDQVYENLPQMASLQKEQTKALLETLIENKDIYLSMIERAYERMG